MQRNNLAIGLQNSRCDLHAERATYAIVMQLMFLLSCAVIKLTIQKPWCQALTSKDSHDITVCCADRLTACPFLLSTWQVCSDVVTIRCKLSAFGSKQHMHKQHAVCLGDLMTHQLCLADNIKSASMLQCTAGMAACSPSILQILQQKSVQLHELCLEGHQMWPVILLQTEARA